MSLKPVNGIVVHASALGATPPQIAVVPLAQMRVTYSRTPADAFLLNGLFTPMLVPTQSTIHCCQSFVKMETKFPSSLPSTLVGSPLRENTAGQITLLLSPWLPAWAI